MAEEPKDQDYMEQLVTLKSLDPNSFDLPDEDRKGKKKLEP